MSCVTILSFETFIPKTLAHDFLSYTGKTVASREPVCSQRLTGNIILQASWVAKDTYTGYQAGPLPVLS